MSIFEDIGTNLAAAAIGFGAHVGLTRARTALLRDRALRKVWKFLREPSHVFVTILREDGFGAAGGYGDMLAAARLIITANAYFPPASEIVLHAGQSAFPRVRSDNLIIIGGGKYHALYRELVAELKPPLHFFDTETESFQEIRNEQRSIVFAPEYDSDGRLVFDIGLLVMARSPYNPDKRVVLAAGSHTYGSAAVMNYATDNSNLREIERALPKANVMLVVGADVTDGVIGKTRRVSNLLTW